MRVTCKTLESFNFNKFYKYFPAKFNECIITFYTYCFLHVVNLLYAGVVHVNISKTFFLFCFPHHCIHNIRTYITLWCSQQQLVCLYCYISNRTAGSRSIYYPILNSKRKYYYKNIKRKENSSFSCYLLHSQAWRNTLKRISYLFIYFFGGLSHARGFPADLTNCFRNFLFICYSDANQRRATSNDVRVKQPRPKHQKKNKQENKTGWL